MKSFFKRKITKIGGLIVLVLVAAFSYFYFSFHPAKQIVWGVNYSPAYARYLGADDKQLFSNILSDLKIKNIRLMVYWEDMEKTEGKFDFSEMDYYLTEAQKANTKIILAVGHKQPRWPECHNPKWFDSLSQTQQNAAILEMLKAVVSHAKSFSVIRLWQVENEPLFNYGSDCPPTSEEFLKEEIDLVRSLDSRPILTTDSGEKGEWIKTAEYADVFGSTMYREVHNPKYGGYVKYPIPAFFYQIRAGILKVFTGKSLVLGVELQAEPWFITDAHQTPIAEQLVHMNENILKQNLDYAAKVGFPENYLWGVEWWNFMRQNGHSEFWDTIKQLNK